MSRSRVGSLLIGVALLGATAFADSDRPAYADADGCDVGVESDFNNDGRSDTVVADPYATVDGQAEAGRIVVLFGDADGLVGEGARGVINQGLGSIGGIAESGDHFGASIAVADIDCDGYTDVVVGTPDEDINGQSNSGYAQVIFGSAAGLSMGKASRNLTQTNFGLPITAGDQFGYAVDALEDVGQGGTPADSAYAIAIGTPGANVDGQNDAGLVAFLAALDGGNVSTFTTQNSPGIPGAAEAGDRFGAAVSLSYLSGVDDFVDCAVGAPNEDVGSVTNAGAVTIVQDIYDFAEAGIGLDQNAAGVPGGAESGDLFGRSLDTVQVGGTSRLAVGCQARTSAPTPMPGSSSCSRVTASTSSGAVPEPGHGRGQRLHPAGRHLRRRGRLGRARSRRHRHPAGSECHQGGRRRQPDRDGAGVPDEQPGLRVDLHPGHRRHPRYRRGRRPLRQHARGGRRGDGTGAAGRVPESPPTPPGWSTSSRSVGVRRGSGCRAPVASRWAAPAGSATLSPASPADRRPRRAIPLCRRADASRGKWASVRQRG